MKTVQRWMQPGHFFSGEPQRVSEEKAVELKKSGEYRYVPKSKWKKEVRDKKPVDKP